MWFEVWFGIAYIYVRWKENRQKRRAIASMPPLPVVDQEKTLEYCQIAYSGLADSCIENIQTVDEAFNCTPAYGKEEEFSLYYEALEKWYERLDNKALLTQPIASKRLAKEKILAARRMYRGQSRSR